MRKILVTGGTVFVSRYVAEYFSRLGDEVYVLNRNSRQQSEGVTLIEADRRELRGTLRGYDFDAVLDITAYTKDDVKNLTEALGNFRDYILISSSAVYPETTPKPFSEEHPTGKNRVWGDYGSNKAAAEKYLLEHVPQAYILRPPYLYGSMQNLYREPFVFECAEHDRTFVLPENENMGLQFFHVEDLCRFMDTLLRKHPENHIFNVGNPDVVTVRDWVRLCYNAAGKKEKSVIAQGDHHIRSYFCFHDYDYALDVSKQQALMPHTIPLEEGLKEAYEWYRTHPDDIIRKPYTEYIDSFIFPNR